MGSQADAQMVDADLGKQASGAFLNLATNLQNGIR
jgi:hypothetical protein